MFLAYVITSKISGRQYVGITARKAASAKIAKIPFRLSSHIARVFHPDSEPYRLQPKQATLFE
jgi:hypothetical protein